MMDWPGLDLHDPWWWLILAVLFGIAEILIPGVFLIWIAIAAAITGVAAMLIGFSLPVQIILFAILCLVATWAGRRWYAGNPVESQDPLLNDRAARLVGEIMTLAEPIVDGRGRVTVGDGAWPCRGPDLPVGAKVRVTGADGTSLRVEPI